MTDFSKKLKEYRQKEGLSQAQLAERCKEIDTRDCAWRQSRIGNYEQGIREPNIEDVKVIGQALDVHPSILAFDNNVDMETLQSTYYYPVLNTVQAGMWTGINDYNGDEGFEMLPSNIKASKNSFLLRIKGDSMLTKFKEGDLILVDPDIQPTPGRFVVAINGGNEATFKKYKELGEFDEFGNNYFELVPLNDVYPTISSKNQPIRIIGVAIKKYSDI